MTNRNQSEDQLIAYEILKVMNTSLEYENVALAAIQAIKASTNWQTVAILVPDSHEQLYVCASIGSLPIAHQLTQKSQQNRTNQLLSALTREDFDHRRCCAITACIEYQGSFLGVLYVSNLESASLQEKDMVRASAIADALAIGLNNVQFMRHLQEKAAYKPENV